jgi:hypothetical protein
MSVHLNYRIEYSAVFRGYGLIALTGLAIVLFLTGQLVQNKELQAYADEENV